MQEIFGAAITIIVNQFPMVVAWTALISDRYWWVR